MLPYGWSGKLSCQFDGTVTDIDPGKDIFALLFLSFFLINTIVLFCLSNQAGIATTISTEGEGRGKPIDNSLIAHVGIQDKKAYLIQNRLRYLIPEDLHRLRKEDRLKIVEDENGNKYPKLFVQDPGKSMTAGEILEVVQMLNREKISVEFHTPEGVRQ
jgi:hypothetical protein